MRVEGKRYYFTKGGSTFFADALLDNCGEEKALWYHAKVREDVGEIVPCAIEFGVEDPPPRPNPKEK